MTSAFTSRQRVWIPNQAGLAIAGLGGIAAYVGVLAYAMEHRSYDVWGALLVFPFLTAIGLPIIWRVCRDDAIQVTGLVSVALGAKVLAAFARYFVIYFVYDGLADAPRYHAAGKIIADRFRSGEIGITSLVPTKQGTLFIEQLVGIVYAVTGPTQLGGFMVFSWIGFWGLFLMYRAALIGVPELDARRFAWALFFAPTMLFWPSSLGKESFLMLALGVFFYGAARFLTQRPGGIVLCVLGGFLTSKVRPHLMAVAVAALFVAYFFRRSRRRGSLLNPVRSAGGLVVMLVAVSLAVTQVTAYFRDDASLGPSDRAVSVSGVLNEVQTRTSKGGSKIEGDSANSITEYPLAFFTVMFRPTLLEVRSATSGIAALETTTLLAFVVFSWRRLGHLPQVLLRRPFLMFCFVYTGIFAFAWSSIGNLGILARQRSLAWPALLLLLAGTVLRTTQADDKASRALP
jgi:hypothetical protein